MRGTVERQLANPDVQAIITTGGTGITSRDMTFEAVGAHAPEAARRLRRAVPDAQLRADRRRRDDEPRHAPASSPARIVVALPGSEAAVRLAMERLLIPELGHLVQQATVTLG